VFLLSHDGSWDNSVLKLGDTIRAMCFIILEVKKIKLHPDTHHAV
jgi:hypothetical protein